ncbi:MAG: sodium-extruding oxaloacetate decarboxylase subunit alpha [Candidatus Thiodiazotropha lotti]|uniref:sodium-extruding oxaloacetate decarboxylase subunit alpha n=1 Tax=Candidatus Thiodiazotropha endoloripes TaxID=1818881 RepID=UPI00083E6B71|nr:sodium-extruding oxaloacetate decarboxylase subunit alpha [Candidatus Thiodiazotropha endoloripes]MCG7901507.1 sodium-extruding oxaloacetate decarboxylase subunit alpha [Candidatus Thiodiazotropha weberae]MCG7990876.1 sodium-extruding oxaloacetate decarboxylase subunit alpha [Candidatus Thiodiazotropha lotti]MCG7999260.1 sodium-extruding oxaloacetate decarboxylase subunit alpha [Candidatus Thiodiazotropha lotti]MCW4182530.1 sodium-extruding oxaloacetate decarboxylase subunit alpha [Candidatu
MSEKKPLGITEVVLRDAHQSLFATRMRIDDMLPIAEKLDKVGFWSLETWGGATFDACIRFLGEDPWDRIRILKSAMPNTPMQMLFRGQNILGYRHYADDVVDKFVERAATNGVDVFRIFDAMNDLRNLETAVKATLKVDKHAQGTMSYTVSPVHNMDYWLDMCKSMEDMGCHSICIKDMAGLLNPYTGYDLVTRLKESISIPIAMHSHATTGMSMATAVKCAEAGVDMMDASISSMSMTYGHSATESVVAILKESDRDTGLDLNLLEEIAAYFREVRKKYAKFEGSLKGVDSRILVAQVPGGMLTNMENQLREQGATDKLDDVLDEIPKVRKDLGYIPLVTPTSQIVGTQAVINVLMGERYKSIAKETEGVLKGEYGATPAPVNAELQSRVLKAGEEAITCRPADLIDAEMDKLTAEFRGLVDEHGIKVAKDEVDDVLIYALFPQVGLKFLKNRDNPDAFEPVPGTEADTASTAPAAAPAAAPAGGPEAYQVEVNGVTYNVKVSPAGAVTDVAPAAPAAAAPTAAPAPAGGTEIAAPLSGNIHAIKVSAGQQVAAGDVVMVLEAMKMETEVRANSAGTVSQVLVKEGDAVQVGTPLLSLS